MKHLLLLLACLAPAFAQRSTPVEDGIARGILHVGNGVEPKGADHHVVTGIPESRIITAVMEGLVAEHPSEDTTIAPGVAERWEVSADGLVYTFHLRADARWSNGDPVTAEDFRYAYNRLLNPALGAEYAEMLYPLRNAEAFHKGALTDFAQVGVEVVDPRTLRLTLHSPVPYLLQAMRHYTWFPVHRPTIEAFGAWDNRSTRWAEAGNHVGNGPFRLREWRVNQVVVVERNPRYWDAANVRLNEIHFYAIENAQSEDTAFHAGQLHITDSVPFARRRHYIETRDPAFARRNAFATSYLLFNVQRGPLADARVRRALAFAIDRETLVDRVTFSGTPAASFTPPMPGYAPPEGVYFDPDEARALLAEAGFPGGAGFPRLTITITTADTTRIVAEAVQAMWKRELGIEAGIQNMEWRVYMSTLTRRDYDIGFLSWWGDYVDPHTFLSVMLTGNGNNRTNWGEPAFDALVNASPAGLDDAARLARLREAEEILLREMPVVPVAHAQRNLLLHPAVEGYHPKLLDQHAWKAVGFRTP